MRTYTVNSLLLELNNGDSTDTFENYDYFDTSLSWSEQFTSAKSSS